MGKLWTIFQNIKKDISAEQKALLAILGSFIVFGAAKIVFGVVPWYFLALAAPMFLAALLHPKAGLYAVIILTVLFERFFTLEGFQLGRDIVKLYSLDVVLFGVYASVFVRSVFRKVRFSVRSADVFFLLFFTAATLYFLFGLAGFGTNDLSVAFSTWKNYVFYGALVFVLPIIIEREDDLRRMMKYFLAAATCAILFLLIGIVRGGGLWTEYTPLSTDGVRLLAFPHAFYFSLAFLGTFVTAGYWFRDARRFGIWALLAFWGLGILGSLMRHMWIGMAFAMLLAFFFLMEYAAKRVAWRVSALAASCAVSLLAAGIFFAVLFPYLGASRSFQSSMEAVGIRMLSIGNSTDESISWRGATWQSAFTELEKHPLLGAGFGAHVAVESGEDYRDFIEVRNIHNSWFAALVQMGIVGMMSLLAALAMLILPVVHMRTDTDITAAARLVFLTLIAYQAVVLLAQPYLETNLTGIFFWLTLGSLRMLLAVNEKQEKRRQKDIAAVSEKALDI